MLLDIPFGEYKRKDCANASTLWRVLSNPRRAKWEIDHPTPPSEQMLLGTAFHALLTGKDAPSVMPSTCNRRSNEGKANYVMWLESVTGHEAPRPPAYIKTTSARLEYQIGSLEPVLAQSSIEIVSEKQIDTSEQMLESLMQKPVAQVLFDAGQGEVTCLQTDTETGLDLKARWDWLPDGHDIIVDAKSTRSAAYEDFEASAERYGYRLQAAFYSWLYELEFGSHPAFFFAVVENTPPYDSAIFEADEDFMENGRRLYRRALDIYAECKAKNFWPGADWEWDTQEYIIQKLNRPRWAK